MEFVVWDPPQSKILATLMVGGFTPKSASPQLFLLVRNFANNRENFEGKFENFSSFFHYCMLSCRYVMLQKSILSKPKWGITSSR